MSDTANVIAGSATLYLAPSGTALPVLTGLPVTWPAAWVSPGYTDAGIDFVYTPTFKDIMVDEEMGPVQKILVSEKLEINLVMAESTLNNLLKAIAGSSLVEGASVSTLYLGSASSTQEWVLGVQGPAPGAEATAGTLGRVIICYRVKASAAVTAKMQRKDKVVFNVKFEALVDSTKSAGQRLCEIIDFNPAGS